MIFKRTNEALGNIKVVCKIHLFSEYNFQLFFAPFCHPSGLAILPNLLCCSGFEILKYVFTPRASNLEQARQLQDLGLK